MAAGPLLTFVPVVRRHQQMDGTLHGRYRLGARIGAGGMGEVYEAEDVVLGRRVAVKVLQRGERADRFVREARAASAIGHPAIVTVYDAGETTDGEESVAWLAMERIDGEPLSKRIRGRRDVERMLDIMAQVADGLAAAHANGIVHRDLKPDNIVVTRDGYAKIVDFGIAKLLERDGVRPAGDTPTTPGAVVGTPAYMAPEQIEARTVDHRADVFAFGCVLHEVLTGESPFRSSTPVDTMHRILHEEPALERVAPPARRIVRRCLAKDAEQRYQSMRDVALDLRDAAHELKEERQERRRGARLPVAAALLLAAVVAVVLLLLPDEQVLTATPQRVAPRPMVMSQITNSGELVSAGIAPDGKVLAYATRQGHKQTLWLRQMATGTDIRLIEAAPFGYTDIRVSPDGTYVYYAGFDVTEPNVFDIYQIPIVGGTPRKIVSDVRSTFALSPDGRRLATGRFDAVKRDTIISVFSLDNEQERVVLTRRHPDEVYNAIWSPQGDALTIIEARAVRNAQPVVYELDLATGERRSIPMPKGLSAHSLTWLPDGSAMLVAAFDRQQPPQIWLVSRDGGEAKKITNDVSWYGHVSVTGDSKTFVATRGASSANLWVVDLDRPRKAVAVTTGTAHFHGSGGVRWLPDGRLLYTTLAPERDGEAQLGPALFTIALDGTPAQRFLRNQRAWSPTLSPDGTRLAYMSDHAGPLEVYSSRMDGTDTQRHTYFGKVGRPAFAPDGKSLVVTSYGDLQRVWRVPVAGGEPVPLTEGPAGDAVLSPDGKLLLCRYRMKVRKEGEPLWRTAVLPVGGGEPRFYDVPISGPKLLQWHPSGEGFLFIDNTEHASNVFLQDLRGGTPRKLTWFDSGDIAAFDLRSDGKAIAVSLRVGSYDAVVVRNFR